MMYANEINIEGLIAVSGKYLHLKHHLSERTRLYPELFHKIIDASGKEFHLILEVKDNNKIASMYNYRRIIIEVS